jgi:hypothetical protein
VCHPANVEWLKGQLSQIAGDMDNPFAPTIEIVANPMNRIFKRRWVFPPHRFIEYERHDELWAIPLGFGHWEDTDEREFYLINDLMWMRNWLPIIPKNRHVIITNVS